MLVITHAIVILTVDLSEHPENAGTERYAEGVAVQAAFYTE